MRSTIGRSSSAVQFSEDQIAVRDELRLSAEERLQDSAGQSCVMPVIFEVFDTLLLVRNVLLASQQVKLSLR
ncbi:hypothetical protein XH94_06405 [Bradyrhizobium zhanjiangense]|uniref:Uncharacterized protein n=1 Tax=Bradyrhizobium zhanjiangense TaxID=1325107 RepID=A0A4Q0SQC2_9BRAD|nr:hypothetical protein XH94_06405 [Bradyrhizobium zhanjiangense]